MRGSAITPAGRKRTGGPAVPRGVGAARAGGTRAGGAARAGGTRAGRATDHPRRVRSKRAPSVPRRVSGPLRRDHARTRATAAQRPRLRTVAQRAGIFLRSLPDRALIDRLVRSQAWILVLGLMLAGIVAMQVEVLKLGASVGRSIERGSALQGRNQLLRASVASLSDDARIERLAADMGMIMPPPGAAGFVAAGAPNRTLQQALANIHAPDPATFLASTAANGAVTSSSIMSNTTGSVVANPPLQSSSSATSSTSSTAAAATPSTTAATPSTTAATPTTTAATPSTTAATPSTAAATPSSTSTATTASTAAQQQPATAGG